MEGKIWCLVGKSASGKDTLFRAVASRGRPDLVPVIPCTTRPMRTGETDGVDYRFVSREELGRLQREGQVLEERTYQTIQGPWTYFTPAFSLSDGRDRLLITTLDGVVSILGRYGPGRVRPVLLDVDDGIRFHRCVEREERQASPDYEELCRRYLADQRDFSPERLARIPGLRRIDTGQPLEDCLRDWDRIFREEDGEAASP